MPFCSYLSLEFQMPTDEELMAQEMANRPVPVEADEAFRKAKIGLMSK